MNTRIQMNCKSGSSAVQGNTSFRTGILQRTCTCGGKAGITGECEECRKKRLGLQRKLSVNRPGDTYEPEADIFTEQDFKMVILQDTYETAEVSEEPTSIPPIVHEVLRSSGKPLESSTRDFMETRFGHDFRRVRIHTDEKAAESARAVNALAYTVGEDVIFDSGRYSPTTYDGRKLLAHELAHVVQQSDGSTGVQAQTIGDSDHPSEREADYAAQNVMNGGNPSIRVRTSGSGLHRSKNDIVAYLGGPSGTILVIKDGKLIFSTRAVSGHPGSEEFEKGVGPIPTGTYVMHPKITRPNVTKLQGGVCGVNAISSGYQEITSNDPSPCADPTNHYCTDSCPTADDPGRMCFTPRGCWGEKRMKIEGSARVAKPTGGFVTRNGFYIHGGNHSVAVTSGCIKVFDDTTFSKIRTLDGVKGAVPMCVGDACPPLVNNAIGRAVTEVITSIAETFLGD
jgi:hypothetical protein